MRNTFIVLLTIIALLNSVVFVINLSSALSASEFIISNEGSISTSRIFAQSGSPDDIQAAVDTVAAIGGGVVAIPEGTFVFNFNRTYQGEPAGVIIPGGVNVIGQGIDKTILRETKTQANDSIMFYIDGQNGRRVRISGITFQGYVVTEACNNRGIRMLRATDFRIDHCKFVDFCGSGVVCSNYVEPYGVNRGLIDHCEFDNPYKDDPAVIGLGEGGRKVWGYGISPIGTFYNWENDINNLLGKYDGLTNIVYIEDCTFSRTRHAVASNGGAFYVVRHCTFIEPRPEHYIMLDVHGSSGAAPAVGGRGLEAYDNTLIGCEYKWQEPGPTYPYASIGGGSRGGGGVIFNNTFVDCSTGYALYGDWVNPICAVKDFWFWNNTITKQNAPTVGTLFENNYGYTEGVAFFLYGQSGYTPYVYPHSLTQQP